jgi:hypothetical protein
MEVLEDRQGGWVGVYSRRESGGKAYILQMGILASHLPTTFWRMVMCDL